MRSILNKICEFAPTLFVYSLVFLVLTYLSMGSFKLYNYLPDWLYSTWYILVFISIYLALVTSVITVITYILNYKRNK